MDDLFTKLGVDINLSFGLIFFTLIWARVLMMASVIPFIFGKPLPKYILVATSFVLTGFIFPYLLPEQPPPLTEDIMLLSMLYLKEIFYGLLIGFSVSIIFHAFSSVGQMIDNQRGASIARLLIPQLGSQGSILGMFIFQLGIVLYLASGGHLIFFHSFFQSFSVLPVLEFPNTGIGFIPVIDLFIQITGEVVYIALQMSTPVILAIFLTDIILGLANRMAPQINVWELGFNVKGYVGVLLLAVSIIMVSHQILFYTDKSNVYSKDVVYRLQLPPEIQEKAPKLPESDGEFKPERTDAPTVVPVQ